MKLKIFLLFFLVISATGSYAQIGIQTNTPDASSALDIVSTNKGLLIPRVTLTSNLNNSSPVTNPATGLLVFNTGANQPVGLYFWNGSSWKLFNVGIVSADYWNVKGNAGTNPATNFLGTTDNQDMAVYTNNSERLRVMANGQIVVGQNAPNSGTDLFSAVSNATQTWAVNGYGDVCGVYGEGSSYGVYGVGGTFGSIGVVNNSGSYAMAGQNQDANGWGSLFAGSGYGLEYLTGHSAGLSTVGNDGFYASGKSSTGYGGLVAGSGFNASTLIGRSAGLSATGNDGIFAAGKSSSGIGIIAGGNGVSTFATIATGAGGAFTGDDGLYSKGINSTGTGVIGVGNNGNNYYTEPNGSGGAFTGTVCGVYGYATNNSGDSYGGYFASNGAGYAYVGGSYGGTNCKIVGTGTVNTIVKNTKGEIVTLTCPEAPESVFQDFGIGQLVNGQAHITIDPDLAININVSDDHPLKVYITPEGDCNGVYVTNKSANGFDVIELQGGKSNVQFSWQIVATRANEEYQLRDGSTETSDYSKRFPPAPPPLEDINSTPKSTVNIKSASLKTLNVKSLNIEKIKGLEKK